MGESAVMLKACYRPAKAPKDIDVRRLGRQGHGQRGVGRSAIEAGAAEACAGKEMGDWFHELPVAGRSSFYNARYV